MTSAARTVLVVAESYLDVVVAIDARTSSPGSTSRATSRLGGSGFTIAAVTAESGLATVLATRVGQDADGSGAATTLAGALYQLALVRDVKRPTGRRTVITDVRDSASGNVVATAGAAGAMYVRDVPRAVLAGARHVHISGFLFMHGSARTAAKRLITRAHEHGCTVSVHPETQWLPQGATAADFLHHIQGADLLIGTSSWAADTLARSPGADSNIEQLAHSLLRFAPAVVLRDTETTATFISTGSRGTTAVAAPGSSTATPSASSGSPTSLGRHESVFIGSFLGTYTAGRSLEYCLTEALAAAGRAELTSH